MKTVSRVLVLGLLVAGVLAPGASADPLVGVDMSCLAPAGNPAPGSPEWQVRDTQNQYCATLRLRDQLASPAYGTANLTLGAQEQARRWQEQLADGPGHVKGGVTPLVPGSQAADAFRSIPDWERLTGGKATRVSFPATDFPKAAWYTSSTRDRGAQE